MVLPSCPALGSDGFPPLPFLRWHHTADSALQIGSNLPLIVRKSEVDVTEEGRRLLVGLPRIGADRNAHGESSSVGNKPGALAELLAIAISPRKKGTRCLLSKVQLYERGIDSISKFVSGRPAPTRQ